MEILISYAARHNFYRCAFGYRGLVRLLEHTAHGGSTAKIICHP